MKTEQDVLEWAARIDEQSDTPSRETLRAAYRIIYGTSADEQAEREGLWSHICAAINGDIDDYVRRGGLVEVRRHNGQCAYGDWLPLLSEDILPTLRECVLDEIAESDEDEGRVDLGGSIWLYRR